MTPNDEAQTRRRVSADVGWSALLGLIRTAHTWSDDCMPACVALLTEKRLRPLLRLCAKKSGWCPVMILCALRIANLADAGK
jgi:hypothetical protein